MRFLLLAMLAIGCVRSQTEPCGDRVCPEGTRCSAYQDLWLCVTPEQTADCEGLDEGAPCGEGMTSGFCRGGACLPIGCGNGRIDDAVFATNEECDDGNRISHDGCSSTCRDEVLRIDEIYPFDLDPITDTTVVTDTSSGTSLLFGGGQYGAAGMSKTWAFVDDRWRRLTTRTGPSGRRSHAAAFDQRRQRLVLFGGGNTDSRFSDTWEFDGTSWHVRSPATTPPPRQNHAMAYDPIRGVIVMFGGRGFGDPDETWEWDGTDWRKRTDVTLAVARKHQAMAFDAGRGVMVMIVEAGPQEGTTTYELADDGWRVVAPPELGPPANADSPLAYDPVSRRILHTGANVSAWDGTAWTSIVADDARRDEAALATTIDGRVLRVGGGEPAGSDGLFVPITQEWSGTGWIDRLGVDHAFAQPGPRTDYEAAYDQLRRRVVVFGGYVMAPIAETWELGLGGWARQAPVTSPSARHGHAMAYDVARGVTVLFGDAAGDRSTWTWNGGGWEEFPVALDGPPARGFATMAYDVDREVVVLFGGIGGVANRDYLVDTWEWDGTTWRQIETPNTPSGRADAALAYDPVRKQMVMFGGRGQDGTQPAVFGDTWTYDGVTWTRVQPSSVPTSRYGHGLAWDPARGRLVMIGGSGNNQIFNDAAVRDVWEWDGTTWVGLDVVSPTGEARIATTQGFSSGTLLFTPVVGGLGALHLGWIADTAYETCTQADHDRDGLVGCADRDCWALCTPTCVPGATCTSGPRCGDGSCSAYEQCAFCPADCGACPAVCGDGTCSAGEDCVGDCTQ